MSIIVRIGSSDPESTDDDDAAQHMDILDVSDDISDDLIVAGSSQGDNIRVIQLDANPVEEIEENQEPRQPAADAPNDETTPNRRKRKRTSITPPTPKRSHAPNIDMDDDDDGQTCPICMDTWNFEGTHRLVALKCGHLFGESCVRRWIQECSVPNRCCPTCKAKAGPRDIRVLYAKKVLACDRSEEMRLTRVIEEERTKNTELQTSLSTLKLEMSILSEKYTALQSRFTEAQTYRGPTQSMHVKQATYRLALDKNIELCRDGGCRAMIYGRRSQTLLVSQKSIIPLFPGFGVRFVSAHTFQPSAFLRMAPKPIRDLSVDPAEEFIAAAAMEKSAFVYSMTGHTPVATITPSESQVWAVRFDESISNRLFVGTQQGTTYAYDTRNQFRFVEEYPTPGDFTPVSSIVCVRSPLFPHGGFIVCKLQSIWFYEYNEHMRTQAYKLPIEGPFVTTSYDEGSGNIMIATRPSSKHRHARYIVGTLMKIDETTVFRTKCTIFGSSTQQVMSRSTQINIGTDSLVAAYVEDAKELTTWASDTGTKMSAFRLEECILDMCPMVINDRTYLASASNHRCRIFQLNNV